MCQYLVEVSGRIISDPNAEEILREMGIPPEAWSSQTTLRKIFTDIKQTTGSTDSGNITEEEFVAAYYRQRLAMKSPSQVRQVQPVARVTLRRIVALSLLPSFPGFAMGVYPGCGVCAGSSGSCWLFDRKTEVVRKCIARHSTVKPSIVVSLDYYDSE